MKSLDFSNVDIITILYGTNDFTSNENTIGIAASTDGQTIKGAINFIVNKLLTAYPNLKVMFITPTHRFWGTEDADDSDTVANDNETFLIDFCTAINEQAHLHHLPCLNLYSEGGLNKYNHATYFTDGVHPNTVGETYLANKISAFVQSQYKF